jgi:hypothetical protein
MLLETDTGVAPGGLPMPPINNNKMLPVHHAPHARVVCNTCHLQRSGISGIDAACFVTFEHLACFCAVCAY